MKFYFIIIEFDYLNTIFIVKSMRLNITISLRFKYNIKYLILFYFKNCINSIFEYNDSRSRECIFYILRSSKLELHL